MRYVLSDLDGVLVDSGDAVERVWREWAIDRGIDPDEVARASHGVPSPGVLERVAPHLNTPAEIDRIERLHAATGGRALPGAAELLERVDAVVTSCSPLLAEPAPAIGGFFLVGIGVANGVPLVFSAAGHAPTGESGPNIAAVSSMGSIGFLAGPPFIGFLAEATSLPLALSTICLGLAVVTVAGRRIGAGAVGPGVPAIEGAH